MNTLENFLNDCNWSHVIENNNFTIEDLTELYSQIHEMYVYDSLEKYCIENEIKDQSDVITDNSLVSIIENYENLEKQFFLNHVYYGNIDIIYFENEKIYGTCINQ